MRVNVNHPSFVTFLDNVNVSILSHVSVDKYFSLSSEKKMGIQFMTLKLLKSTVNLRVKLSDLELRSFITVLCQKNEESENYEFAAILKDLSSNFDCLNEKTKPVKRQSKTIKIDKNKNG